MKKFIVAAPHPSTGISNKIKCIISTLRACNHLSKQPLIYWPKNIMCPVKFSELFEIKIPQLDEKGLDNIKKRKDFSYCSSYLDLVNNKKTYSIINTWRFILLPGEVPKNFGKVFPDRFGENIDLEFERIPFELRKEYFKYFKKLKPSKEIGTAADFYIKKNDIRKVIGLHIRRGDFVDYKDGRGVVSSDEKFSEKISKLISKNKKIKFFLATDSKETQEKFKNLFGDRILFFPDKDFRRNTKKSISDAFIDLLILSKTKQIFGTYLSTFSEVAWWFGGCKQKVEIIGDKNLMRKISKNNFEKSYSNRFRGNIKIILKSFFQKSFLLNKFYEKVEHRRFKKMFSSKYNS